MSLDDVRLETALAYTRAYRADPKDEDSAATTSFASWASRKLRWSALALLHNTTKPGLVFKDQAAEFGKTFCSAGDIIQISKRFIGDDFEALIALDDSSVVRLIAVGSSGQLVRRDRGRFCAFVMGTHTYSNVSGGTTTAVDAVGMFDVPENHKN